jgi:ribosomal protein S24E
MEIQITKKEHDQLLDRTVIQAKVAFVTQKVPERSAIAQKLGAILNSEAVVVTQIDAPFGQSFAVVHAHTYKSMDELKKKEPHHQLVRAKLAEKKSAQKK